MTEVASPRLDVRLRERLRLAGFTLVGPDGGHGGVQVQRYGDPQVGVLVNWTADPRSFEPMDPQLIEVEAVMADALAAVLRALGFRATRFATSYRVRVEEGQQ